MSRSFADFKPGDEFVSATHQITREEIVAFAQQFDPQPAHLDEASGGQSLLGGLAASGWQTAAISMRLFIEVMDAGVGMIGVAVDKLRWPKPVRAGDKLRVELEILETRLSEKRPGFGLFRYRSLTKNQDDETVQSFCATALMPAAEKESLGEKAPGQ